MTGWKGPYKLPATSDCYSCWVPAADLSWADSLNDSARLSVLSFVREEVPGATGRVIEWG